ncbi:hypothetical protein [Ferruginibacter sp. HRS2-29]|uniref:hypothetical protein n=1 Tax=Ferruginibacter sp. HRS2-29 TaxID=2487334 RepID=UPI0020CF092F|nr:hypothetical protein [Ferruginibacter sp. HRS2-29]MCP9751856.1 hypothetical protein [Ferruginibacter sp. HRS2-29]
MSLLHIPSEKKKLSKKDGPLEKETRRFNRLVKEIEELQKSSEQHKAEDELYHKLFLEKVHPMLIDVSKAQVKFIAKLEKIFYAEKFPKNVERDFIEFAIPILQDAAIYSDEAKTMLGNYLQWQASLVSKQEKHPVAAQPESEDELPQGDIINEEETEYKNIPDLDKKSVTELYKELAKQVHPDLERDETLRQQKEQLMTALIEAKNKEDIYSMLIIRQKAAEINKEEGPENPYTLQLLKKYNASLKKKLEGIKREIQQSVFSSFHSKEEFFAHGKKKQTVETRIHLQQKNLKELQDNLEENTRIIRNGQQLKQLLNQ